MNNRTTALALLGTETKKFIKFFLSELKPRGNLLTPFNILATVIISLGVVLLVIRFAKGLGSITNLSQDYPWGLWKGFNVITGVAFAGGAYVLTFLVYILHMEKLHAIVRVTVLNGFLAYVFYAGALILELGRPWNIINPIIGNSYGVSSVMFLVAWHFLLYMIAEFFEFSPAVAEWLGWKRVRKVLASMTMATVIFGVTLSTLHQAGLGAIFLMAKDKVHPLWYSEFIPITFVVSSIFAGLSMVIFEGSISQKVFAHRVSTKLRHSRNEIITTLAKICAGTMFVYLFLQIVVLLHGHEFNYLFTPMGYWYLVEVLGFVLVPCLLFAVGLRDINIKAIRAAAVLTLIGVMLNRLNVSIIAFKWYSPNRYYPTWMEVVVTLAVIFGEIMVYRWVVNRMPVLDDAPKQITRPGDRQPEPGISRTGIEQLTTINSKNN